LTFEQQLLDSCDYPHRPWITELWGPTGTRYHATHHLFPSMPYHNLGIAHRRLMAELPPESIYRETCKISLLSEIAALWKRSTQAAGNSKINGRIDGFGVTASRPVPNPLLAREPLLSSHSSRSGKSEAA
jgi:hypothetical protein